MTDTQVLRRKITQSCIGSLEEKIRKSRLSQDEIQKIIVSEIIKMVKEEF